MCLDEFRDGNVVRQVGIERSQERINPVPARPLNCKAYDLTQRVNAGVCPPCPDDPGRLARYSGQRLLKFCLNRLDAAPLSLEAVISSSVILNGRSIGSAFARFVLRFKAHTYRLLVLDQH